MIPTRPEMEGTNFTASPYEPNTNVTDLPATGMTNPPDPEIPAPTAVEYFVALAYGVSALFTLLGNLLVIVAVKKFRFLQNTANTFVAGLALVDLCMTPNIVLRGLQEISPTAFTGFISCQAKMMVASWIVISSCLTLLGGLAYYNSVFCILLLIIIIHYYVYWWVWFI